MEPRIALFKFEGDVGFSSKAVAEIQHKLGLKKRINSEPTSERFERNGNKPRKYDLMVYGTRSRNSSREADDLAPKSSHRGYDSKARHQEPCDYEIDNYLWYWLFMLGSFLGDFPFYFTFFPFWFYNINSCIIRRVIFMWTTTMYIGQAAKEVLKWPRPKSPPVVPLEPRYFKEYGMPSTHAMVGTLIPFSILFLTMDVIEYSVPLGFLAATAWMLLVSFSRLYKGMHYILDVVVGVVLTFALMGMIFPFLERIDTFLMENPRAPLVLSAVITFLSLTYPSQRGISSTREDTIVILSTTGTIYTSLWLNKHFQIHEDIYDCALPATIHWPSFAQVGLMLCRGAVGIMNTVLAYVVLRPIVLETLSFIYSTEITPETRKRLSVEFPYKYVTYTLTGFVCLLGSPYLFTLLGIDK